MKKTHFSKVFSHENRLKVRLVPVNLIIFSCAIAVFFMACAEKVPDAPVIARINGEAVYMRDLDVLGSLACSEAGLNFNTPAGQQHYKSIAVNLYRTLIDLYIMKFAAEREGIAPTPEEVETEFARFTAKLKSQGIYEDFFSRLDVDEDRLRETLSDRLAIQRLQKMKLSDAEAEVTDQEVRDFYYKNQKLFRYPNLMRVSHIFVRSPREDDPETRKQARIRAEQLLKMVGDIPSRTFAGLAREHSDDEATKVRGGDLGFILKSSTMLPGFKEAAFALKEGEVSPVIESPQGYHIIWATDHEQSFEEAVKQVKQMKIQEKKSAHFANWIKETAKEMDIVQLFDPKEFKVLPGKSQESSKKSE